MDPKLSANRIGRLQTRIVAATTREAAPSRPAWYKCQIPGCNKICTRREDLDRHSAEIHTTTVHACKYCPSKFSRANNLTKHMRRTHTYVFTKTGISVHTQTAVTGQLGVTIQTMEEIESPEPSETSISSFSGRQGTSTTLTSNKSLQQVVKEFQQEQQAVIQSCGFKKVAQLEKTIAATKRQYGFDADKPLPIKKVRKLTNNFKNAIKKPSHQDLLEASTSNTSKFVSDIIELENSTIQIGNDSIQDLFLGTSKPSPTSSNTSLTREEILDATQALDKLISLEDLVWRTI